MKGEIMEFIGAGMCFVFATVAMTFVTKLAIIENQKEDGSRKKKKSKKSEEIDTDAYMQGYMAAMQAMDNAKQ